MVLYNVNVSPQIDEAWLVVSNILVVSLEIIFWSRPLMFTLFYTDHEIKHLLIIGNLVKMITVENVPEEILAD
jgi:hypothetical protein